MGTEMSQHEVDELFVRQIFNDSRRVAYCAIGMIDEAERLMLAKGWDQLVTVKSSRFVINPGSLIFIDELGIEASSRASRLRYRRNR